MKRLDGSRLWMTLLLTSIGCYEETPPCMTDSYDVELGDVIWESALTDAHTPVLEPLGEGWSFGIRPIPTEGGDRRSCYVVGARYDPPPAGLAVFEGGAVAFTDGFYKAAAALTDNLALEYEGCSGGVEMVLRFSTEAHSVEDAVRRDAPIAAHLCYYIKEKDTPECVYLKSKLASVGRGCLLREAKLTRKPEEP